LLAAWTSGAGDLLAFAGWENGWCRRIAATPRGSIPVAVLLGREVLSAR
jgi:hypothetical protein